MFARIFFFWFRCQIGSDDFYLQVIFFRIENFFVINFFISRFVNFFCKKMFLLFPGVKIVADDRKTGVLDMDQKAPANPSRHKKCLFSKGNFGFPYDQMLTGHFFLKSREKKVFTFPGFFSTPFLIRLLLTQKCHFLRFAGGTPAKQFLCVFWFWAIFDAQKTPVFRFVRKIWYRKSSVHLWFSCNFYCFCSTIAVLGRN